MKDYTYTLNIKNITEKRFSLTTKTREFYLPKNMEFCLTVTPDRVPVNFDAMDYNNYG